MTLFWRAVYAGLALAAISAWSHGGHLKALGWVLLLGVAWVARAYFWPYAPCWACHGRKARSCWRCKGSGMRQVAGSKTVHRAVRGIRGQAWKAGK